MEIIWEKSARQSAQSHNNAAYSYRPVSDFTLTIGYGYEQTYKTESRNLYHLIGLDDWDSETGNALGTLPSEEQYLQTVDLSNSYNSCTFDRVQIPEIGINWWIKVGKTWRFSVYHKMQLPVHNQTLRYKGADADTTFTRHSTQFRIYNSRLQLFSNRNLLQHSATLHDVSCHIQI